MAWQAGRRVGWGPTRRKHYQLCFSLLSLWLWPFDMPDPHTVSHPVLFVLPGAFDLAAMKKAGTTGTHLLWVMGRRMGLKE